MSLSLVTPPVSPAIDLSTAKAQCRVTHEDDDDLIDGYCAAATERAELATQRALLTQTWDLVVDDWPAADTFEMPKAPLRSVTSVQYLETAGTWRTMTPTTDYLIEAPAGPRCQRGRVHLPFAATWPIAIGQPGAIKIRFVCGYGATPDEVPALLRTAMLLDVGAMWENRSSIVTGTIVNPLPMGSSEIYWSYRAPATRRRAA